MAQAKPITEKQKVTEKQKLPRVVALTVLFTVCIAMVWCVARLVTMFVAPDTIDLMFIIVCAAMFGYLVGVGHGKE